MNKTKQLMRTMVATVLITSCTAWAANEQTNSPPQSASPGQYGWGMMGGYGGGYGMGPGMMGGYGMGPGMMGGYGGGYGMGQGMMGGYGMGPGMMGGFGMGPGMMFGWAPGTLDLTEEQQDKIGRIQDDTRKKHWELMGKINDEQAKLRNLYSAPKRDDAAISKVYKDIGQLQQQMYESSVDAQKRMDAILTKEQRERMRNYWRRSW